MGGKRWFGVSGKSIEDVLKVLNDLAERQRDFNSHAVYVDKREVMDAGRRVQEYVAVVEEEFE